MISKASKFISFFLSGGGGGRYCGAGLYGGGISGNFVVGGGVGDFKIKLLKYR